MKRLTFLLLLLTALALSAYAASVPPLLPRGVVPTDRLPVINTGTSNAYTVSPDQLSSYVQGQISTASATRKGLVKGGGIGIAVRSDGTLDATGAAIAEGVIVFENLSTAIKGRYQWIGADAAGSGAAAVTGHEAAYNHESLPTAMQRSALLGSYGTPGSSNRYVTDADPRNVDARTPKAHAATHGAAGTDPVIISSSQVTGLDAALSGKQATLANAATLGEIGEIGGLPLWKGGTWPGGGGQAGGDMYKATYDPANHAADAFSRANHTGTQPANTVTGLAASATTDTTTTANIADSANKRFVTDAQRTVLSSTSGTNTGDETQATIKAKLGAATDGVDGYLTAADHLKLTGAQPAATAITTANIGAQTANLTQDSTHLFATAAEKAAWNGKQNALTAGVDYLAPNGSAAALTGFPTLNQNTTGNAATATKLATARTINGVPFDGTGNISISSPWSSITGTPTTLAGYGISDAYTRAFLDSALAGKLSDAPSDGNSYARKNGAWSPFVGGVQPFANISAALRANGITTPSVTSAAPDGTHGVWMKNTVAYTGARTGGAIFHNMTTMNYCETDNNCRRFGSGNSSSSGGTWGGITGTLSAQSDLNTALAGKVDKNSTNTNNLVFASGVGPVLTAANGNTYRLTVDNSGNLSTAIISGTSAPNAPVMSATGGNGQIVYAWSAPAADGSHDAATSYNLRYGTVSGTLNQTKTNVASPYTLSPLTNGVTIYAKLDAINSGGTTSQVSEVSATPSVSTWYLPGSTTTGQVEFAYNAKGAASYAASKSNLASPGTHDATDGTSYPTWAAGTGWTFNGTSQYLVASSTSGAIKPFTMIARVNIPDTTGQYTMIGGGTTGNATWRIRNDGKAELDSLNTAGIGNSTGTATAGSSHVYAVTYSGTGVWTYYIDGVASGTGTTDVTFAAGAAHKIGTQTDSGNVFSNWFKGSMQAVAKYNVVLSGGDIASLSTVMAGL